MSKMKELLGKTLTKVVTESSNYGYGSNLVTMICDTGEMFSFHHHQDCCESVDLDDVDGTLGDLIGSPITLAEEVTNVPDKPKDPGDAEGGTFTWTFYRLATIKGYVTFKFYGTSNGYYSESVDFIKIEQP